MIRLKQLLTENRSIIKEQGLLTPDINVNLRKVFESGDWGKTFTLTPGDIENFEAVKQHFATENIETRIGELNIYSTATKVGISEKSYNAYWKGTEHESKIANSYPGDTDAKVIAQNEVLSKLRGYSLYKQIILVFSNNIEVSGEKKSESWWMDHLKPKIVNKVVAKGEVKKAEAKIVFKQNKFVEPINCQFNYKVVGSQKRKDQNFANTPKKGILDIDKEGTTLNLKLDSYIYPDAIWAKVGNYEEFLGFGGTSFTTLRTKSGNTPGAIDGIRTSNPEWFEDMCLQGYYPRAWLGQSNFQKGKNKGLPLLRVFSVELVYLVENHGLIDSIKTVIENNGGTPNVTATDLFEDYDTVASAVSAWKPRLSKMNSKYLDFKHASKWWNQCKSTDLNGKILRTKKLDQTYNGQEGTVIVWSPLSKTIFNVEAECG